MCKEYNKTQQIQIHLPSSFSNRKGQQPYLSEARKWHLPYYVKVLNCALHTLGFMSGTPKKTKINIKLLTPNINKWFLQ